VSTRANEACVAIRSTLLGSISIPHAFATRHGGVSSGDFASLNFGNPGELPPEGRDPPSNIRENYRRLMQAAGCPGRELVEVHQVHGAGVLAIRAKGTDSSEPESVAREWVRADAIVTDDPERVLSVRIADCAPVLLAARDGRVVAAAHAGWRGVIAGVVPAAIAAMRELGATEIAAAVGPCIGPDAFEVGPEVVAEFERVFGFGTGGRGFAAQAASGTNSTKPGPQQPNPLIRPGRADRSHVDLAAAIQTQLHESGITQIDLCRRCTVSEPQNFFSHRRDGPRSGRMAAIIACRAD
jgi:YfiH family protein